MLLLNQFFHPSIAPTGRLLTDLAQHLAQEGREVVAICGRNKYDSVTVEEDPIPNVTVHRIPTLPFGTGRLSRVANYTLYYLGAALLVLTARRQQIIVTLSTPPLLSTIGTLAKKLRGVRHVCWEMDVYPDVATQLGILAPRGRIARAIGAISDWSRREADAIIALGDDMKDLLVAHGIPQDKIFVVENWADCELVSPLPFPHGPLHILYSGHLGMAHDTDTIQGALVACNDRDAERYRFTFAGGGSGHIALKSFASTNNLTNVDFRGYCSRTNLAASLSQGHAGLVTQHRALAGAVVPSKIYGIMAAGRPVIFVGPADTTPARLIERYGCGWQIRPGDVGGLVKLLDYLDTHPSALFEAGRRAREAFLLNHTRDLGVRNVASILESPPAAASASPESVQPSAAKSGAFS